MILYVFSRNLRCRGDNVASSIPFDAKFDWLSTWLVQFEQKYFIKKKKLFCYTSFFGEIVAKLFILSAPNHLRMYNLVELCTDYHNKVLNKQKICDRSTYRLREKVAKSVEILMGETTLIGISTVT